MTLQRDDPLTQIRIHAHLYGRSHAGRVVTAVLDALRPHLPETLFRDLVAELPADVEITSEIARPEPFIAAVARRLHAERPDAAFYARVTFEQLNVYCRGITPAAVAASAPAALRPLLTARPEDPTERYRRLLRRAGAPVGALSLRMPPPERDAARPAVAALGTKQATR